MPSSRRADPNRAASDMQAQSTPATSAGGGLGGGEGGGRLAGGEGGGEGGSFVAPPVKSSLQLPSSLLKLVEQIVGVVEVSEQQMLSWMVEKDGTSVKPCWPSMSTKTVAPALTVTARPALENTDIVGFDVHVKPSLSISVVSASSL